MNTKPKLLFFAIGGIILILAAAFIWYRLYQDNSESLKTNTKEIINNSNNSSKNKSEKGNSSTEQAPEEKPVPEGISVSSSKSDEEIEKTTQESDNKFNSNKDEEDTSDGVSVEVEPTDE